MRSDPDPRATWGRVFDDERAVDVIGRARAFRRRWIDPVAAELDERLLVDPHLVPTEAMERGCEYGLYSLPIPDFVGGGGRTILHCALVLEELCAGCAGIANVFGAHYLGVSGIVLGLDLNHYDRFLREVVVSEARGVPVVFSAAITEPMAGTDVEDRDLLPLARLVTFARRVDGGYVLDGRKCFISNGSIASYHTIICPIDREHPVETLTGFVVPKTAKGLSVGRVELKMGQRACHAAELVLDGCFVPAEDRIGLEGGAMRMTEVVLAASRAPVGAIATGIARGALERTLVFVREQRLGHKAWVQAALAEMDAAVRAARGLYVAAGAYFDDRVTSALLAGMTLMSPVIRALGPLRRTGVGRRLTAGEAAKRRLSRLIEQRVDRGHSESALGLSSVAKATCSDLAVSVCLRALDVLGDAAAEQRHGVEKCLRDAKLTQIYEGTNQLNRHAAYATLLSEGAP